MSWRSMMMPASEFVGFQRDLKREYRQEIADGKIAGYTLFTRRSEAGDYLLFIPPGAVVLFERMPRWQPRLKEYNGAPNLKGFEPVPVS